MTTALGEVPIVDPLPLTALDGSTASEGDVLYYDGTNWVHRSIVLPDIDDLIAHLLTDDQKAALDGNSSLSSTRIVASIKDIDERIVYLPAASGDTTGQTDRANIQAIMDEYEASGETVRVRARHSAQPYIIGRTGSATNYRAFQWTAAGASRYLFGILIPPNIILDGGGCKIQPVAGQDIVMVSQKYLSSHDCGFVNWTVDGLDQSTSSTNQYALCHFENIVGFKCGGLRMVRTQFVGLYLSGIDRLDSMDGGWFADGCKGSPFGPGTIPHPLTHASLGPVFINNVTEWPANTFNFPGNPFGGCFVDSTCVSMVCTNSQASIKIYGSTDGLAIAGGVVVDACSNIDFGNSGFKIQGDGTYTPRNVTAPFVVARNCAGMGMYLELSEDNEILRYYGKNNDRVVTSSWPEVWEGGTRNRIGSLFSEGSGQSVINVRPYSVGFKLGTGRIRNPCKQTSYSGSGSNVAVDNAGGEFSCPDLMIEAPESDSHMAIGLRSTSTSSKIDAQVRVANASTGSVAVDANHAVRDVYTLGGFSYNTVMRVERPIARPTFGSLISVNADKTFSLADAFTHQLFDTSAGRVKGTIPTNAAVAFPIGAQIKVERLGAGFAATIGITSGVTVRTAQDGRTWIGPNQSVSIGMQYGTMTLTKTGTDEWLVEQPRGLVKAYVPPYETYLRAFKGETVDPNNPAATFTVMTTSILWVAEIVIVEDVTTTLLKYDLGNAAVGLTLATWLMYNGSGILRAQGPVSGSTFGTANTENQATWTAESGQDTVCRCGDSVYIGLLTVGTTGPALLRHAAPHNSILNRNRTGIVRRATAATSQSSVVSDLNTITTFNTNIMAWAGLQ